MSWEDTYKHWGSPPSATERQKMDNAETAIRKAIDAHPKLSALDVSIIPQGSYRARTNVRLDSDVDICVCLNSTFFPRYPSGKTKEHYGNIDGTISYKDFKALVVEAMGKHFGDGNITPGNKAIDIHSNTYRVDTDVLPALAYRYYHGDSVNDYIQPTGVGFDTSTGARIINWPHQTYENGLDKHKRTGERFRKMVRIVKRLRNKMQEENIASANDIASFLIESMVWNVPDEGFNHDTYAADVRYVLATCFNVTQPTGSYADLYEVNNIKRLFSSDQPWTREQAHAFFSSAWDYLGFE